MADPEQIMEAQDTEEPVSLAAALESNGKQTQESSSSALDLHPDPYAAPAHVIYPDGAIPNPNINSRAEQPTLANLPTGALYRPAKLPADFDDRLNLDSVWMGVQKGTNRAVYFLPNACVRCAGNARFCDRGFPTCGPCKDRSGGCKPGLQWASLRPKPKARISKANNYSAMPLNPNIPPPRYPGGHNPSSLAHQQQQHHLQQHQRMMGYGHVGAVGTLGSDSPTTASKAAAIATGVSGWYGHRGEEISHPVRTSPPHHRSYDTLDPSSSATASSARVNGHALTHDRYSPGDISPHHPRTLHDAMTPATHHSPSTHNGKSSDRATPIVAPHWLDPVRLPASSSSKRRDDDVLGEYRQAPVIAHNRSTNVGENDDEIDIQDTLDNNPLPEVRSHVVSPVDKGKGRAMEASPEKLDGDHLASPPSKSSGHVRRASSSDEDSEESTGRGKRIRKKRRLSRDQIDPTMLDAHGRLKVENSNDTSVDGPTVSNQVPSTASASASRKRPSAPRASYNPPPTLPANPEAPLSAADKAYFERLERNANRYQFKSMKYACPVWANTRKALQAGTEFFRNPRSTDGASVEIGIGGVARGVILEGDAPKGRSFWGEGKMIGSMILPIGKPRFRRRNAAEASGDKDEANGHIDRADATPVLPDIPQTPKINVLPDIRMIDPDTGADTLIGGSTNLENTTATINAHPEEPCVEALLVAQRAATPIAVAVTKDYSLYPFCVPRGVVGLGWFWVIDAWLESSDGEIPVAATDREYMVQWHFRFEYCNSNARPPWWQEEHAEETRQDIPVHTGRTWQKAYVVSGPGVTGSTTVEDATDADVIDGPHVTQYRCPDCSKVSTRIYQDEKRCLNEGCRSFLLGTSPYQSADNSGLGLVTHNPLQPAIPLPKYYVEPETLGLKLRGAKPFTSDVPANSQQVGKDFWRGWICYKCGMAGERRKWRGWECDGCKHMVNRAVVQLSQVRNPIRPICTGHRQDNGFPSFPYPVLSSWTLYNDTFSENLKVVKHILPLLSKKGGEVKAEEPVSDEPGGAAVIHHALFSHTTNVDTLSGPNVLTRIWKDFQVQGSNEMPFKRQLLQNVSRRNFEKYLCPYYTASYGPENPPVSEALPTSTEPIPWSAASESVLDLIDYVNFRAGCMFPHLPEFNSLLIAASPPANVGAYQPKISVSAGTYMSIVVLGSECTLKIRRAGKGRAAELIMQHGDVVGVHADEESVELQIKMDGFGFFGIARQAYKYNPEPGIGAMYLPEDPRSWKRDLKSEQTLLEDTPDEPGVTEEFGHEGHAAPGASTSINGLVDVSAGNGLDASLGDAFLEAESKGNVAPPVPTKVRNPLEGWYVGPHPLDPQGRQLRGAPLFERPDGENLPVLGVLVDRCVAGDERDKVESEAQDESDTAPPKIKDTIEYDYTYPPPTPKLVLADIPPSPTAPAEIEPELIDDTSLERPNKKREEKRDKSKAKKRQSEVVAGVKDVEREGKKQKRLSEPAPKESAKDGTVKSKKGKSRVEEVKMEPDGAFGGDSPASSPVAGDKKKTGDKKKKPRKSKGDTGLAHGNGKHQGEEGMELQGGNVGGMIAAQSGGTSSAASPASHGSKSKTKKAKKASNGVAGEELANELAA